MTTRYTDNEARIDYTNDWKLAGWFEALAISDRTLEERTFPFRFLFCSRRVLRSSIYFLYISIAGVYLRTGKGQGREKTAERGVKTFHLITASPVNIKYIPPISEKYFIKRDNLKSEYFDSDARGQIEPAMKTFLKYSSTETPKCSPLDSLIAKH